MADENTPGKKTPLGIVDKGIDKGEEIADEARRAAAETSVSEQIEALKAEIGRLKESAGLVAEGTGQLAVAQVQSLREEIRQTVVANPLAALAGAAFIGYLCGLRHHR